MEKLRAWSTYIGALGIAIIVAAFLLGLITEAPRNVLLLLGGLGVVFVAFYFITRPRDQVRQESALRIASEGGNVVLAGLAVIGIVAAINFIVDKQFDQRIDLTENKIHTLAPQTVKVLQDLKEPVQVTGFFTPATLSQRNQAETLLKDYEQQTDKLVVQMVDPDENPALAQKYDNALPGTLVFEKGSRTEKVYNFDENSFTNAILKVTQTQQPTLYFTTGHGEYDTTSGDTAGLGSIVDYLKQVNYKVAPLNTATISGTVPADTSAIVIAGPTKAFSDQDEKLVQDYLDKGGRVLLLVDPATDPGMSALLKEWGVTLDNNLILDPGQNYRGNLPIPVFLSFPTSPVTTDLASLGVYLPGARSLEKDTSSTKTFTDLLTTTADACAKADFAKLQQTQQPTCEDGDKKGPFTAGLAVEGAGTGGASADARGRLIVLGNAAFLTNRWMNNQDSIGNQQLVANSVNWLAGQEQLIAIPPRDPNLRPLNLTTGGDLNLVFWSSVALIPLAALTIGGLLWWRRR